MNKFWKWKKQKVINQDGGEGVERVLELRGTIASESWYDDDITPKMFKDELLSGRHLRCSKTSCFPAAVILRSISILRAEIAWQPRRYTICCPNIPAKSL